MRVWTIVAVALALTGCASRGVARGRLIDPEVSGGSTVQPGDRIALKVFQERELNDTITVQQSGAAILPLLGSVPVQGRRAAVLQDSLRGAYARFLRNPAVEITILRRIGVQGEVRRPDLYLIDETMTLRDVIAKAGGVSDSGDPKKISVVRDGRRIRFSNAGGNLFLAEQLRSGDQVFVGRRNWFEVNSLAIASTAAVVTSVILSIFR